MSDIDEMERDGKDEERVRESLDRLEELEKGHRNVGFLKLENSMFSYHWIMGYPYVVLVS